jgi:hypothetical protein
MMRSTGNFSSEWGYLAPAPSLLRTVRVVLVATAVGATAGAGVVLSLVDRSTGDGGQVSAAAHAIVVTSAQAAPVQALAPVQPIAPAQPLAAMTPAVIAAPAAVTAPTVSDVRIAPAPAVTAAAPSTPQPDNTAQPAMTQGTQPGSQQGSQQASQQVSATPRDSANDAEAVSNPQPAVATLSDAPTPAAPAAPAVANDTTLGDQTIVGPQQPKKTKHHTANAFGAPGIGTALRHLFSARAGTSYYPH